MGPATAEAAADVAEAVAAVAAGADAADADILARLKASRRGEALRKTDRM